MLLSRPSIENTGHCTVASGHTASVMQAAAAALARSSKRAAVYANDVPGLVLKIFTLNYYIESYRHIYEILNINKKINYTVWLEITRKIF